jgi:hypothetical protein
MVLLARNRVMGGVRYYGGGLKNEVAFGKLWNKYKFNVIKLRDES